MITLKTLPEATEQEVFTQMVNHMIKQGKRSLSEGDCSYRGSSGLKCPGGCLIADDEYRQGMEGSNWLGLIDDEYATKAHVDLIMLVQSVHDGVEPEGWESKLSELANNRHLTMEIHE